MESYDYLIYIAVILLSTKALGLLSQKVHMPAVVGALVSGVILGPSCLNLVNESDLLVKMAEFGVIILMFLAGVETDLDELKKTGFTSFIVALIGVLVPLLGGTLVYAMFFNVDFADKNSLLKAIFVGVVLTATSVSITVETLREMGKLNGRLGATILGAAILDDIIGIIVLTIITSLSDSSGNSASPISITINICVYFIFIICLYHVLHFLKNTINKNDHKRRSSIYALAFCFILAYISEQFFGIADITGAYFAGIMFCSSGIKPYISNRINIASYLFFSPIFFASIGIKTSLGGLTGNLITFAVVLLVIAIATKVVGCGLGAKINKFSNKEALAIGIGMVSRGEVALIVSQKGSQVNLLDSSLFPPVVLVVIVTTLITPILLKLVLGDSNEAVSKNKK